MAAVFCKGLVMGNVDYSCLDGLGKVSYFCTHPLNCALG